MSIIIDETMPRRSAANRQVSLPNGSELVCIEVPKIFDQVCIKRSLIFDEGLDTDETDRELRSNPLFNPSVFIGCGSFNLKIVSIEKIPFCETPDYKRITLCFVIWFYAYFKDSSGRKRKELYEINRTEVIPKLYCPDALPEKAAPFTSIKHPSDAEREMVKVEMLAQCIDGSFTKDCNDHNVLDITLEFQLLVKCELVVQLLVPAYNYCKAPRQNTLFKSYIED